MTAEDQELSIPARRYILFVGNLPYKASAEEVKKHFATAGDASVRLITDKKTGKPKGFAFVEFPDVQSFTRGLAFHHTTFRKRSINVEMTSGGGGNGENRKRKLSEKNLKLDEKRRKIHEERVQQEKAQPENGEEGAKKKKKSKKSAAQQDPMDRQLAASMKDIAKSGRLLVSGPNSIAVAQRKPTPKE